MGGGGYSRINRAERLRTLNIEHSTSNIERLTLNYSYPLSPTSSLHSFLKLKVKLFVGKLGGQGLTRST